MLLAGAWIAEAQGQSFLSRGKEAISDDAGIDVRADRLEYDADNHLMMGRGHVVVSYGPDTLKADMVDVNTKTREAHAKGNITFTSEGRTWEGQELKYNFTKRQGNFGEFKAFTSPYYIRAKESSQTDTNEFVLRHALLTTCEGDRPELYLRASTVRYTDNDGILRANNAVMFLGPIPVFYWPFFRANTRSTTQIDIVPGYSERMGGFLLTSITFPFTPTISGTTHVDYRQKRGLGFGQDFMWEATNRAYMGEVKGYYLNDDKPYKDDEEKQAREALMKEERYRVRLSDVRSLSPRDSLYTEVNYLSDPWVLSDFFDDEYRHNAQPENRVTLSHRGDRFTAGILANKRLNDFYENVDRIPEAYLNLTRQQILETPFYFQGDNSAAYLQRVYPELDDKESYDAIRLDSANKVYWPMRYFGFLNVIPRSGYRGTYYSKTYETETITNTVPITDTNGVVIGFTNMADTITRETGGELRNMLELGLETSFKAFKVITDDPIGLGHDTGLRHVAEPYANYTFVPEPNLRPTRLPQFDYIDKLDKRNDIRVGMRNKLQTKKVNYVHDLLKVDVWTYYRLDPEETQNEFSDVYFQTELRLVDWMSIDFDGQYNTYESELNVFNTQVAFISEDESRLSFEYRYQKDKRDQITGQLKLWPQGKWSLTAYGRYDIENQELAEHSYGVEHRSTCTGQGIYFKQVDDEPEIWFMYWLLALPRAFISIGR